MSKATRRSARGYALQILYARDGDHGVAVEPAVAGWAGAFDLEVDGGVHRGNAQRVVDAGADVLVAGNAVFSAPSYAEAIAALRSPA